MPKIIKRFLNWNFLKYLFFKLAKLLLVVVCAGVMIWTLYPIIYNIGFGTVMSALVALVFLIFIICAESLKVKAFCTAGVIAFSLLGNFASGYLDNTRYNRERPKYSTTVYSFLLINGKVNKEPMPKIKPGEDTVEWIDDTLTFSIPISTTTKDGVSFTANLDAEFIRITPSDTVLESKKDGVAEVLILKDQAIKNMSDGFDNRAKTMTWEELQKSFLVIPMCTPKNETTVCVDSIIYNSFWSPTPELFQTLQMLGLEPWDGNLKVKNLKIKS